ncbi:MAG: TIGR04282 family arsenosugar biosynthesis glycosyltransferase [Saprospiraceae bacterium]
MKENVLIVFLKNFDLGKVKTRIAKDCNNEEALNIYRQLCSKTFSLFEYLNCDIKLYYSNYFPEGPSTFSTYIQLGTDLGEKMSNAIQANLKEYKKVVLIGTDCPYLRSNDIIEAFAQLQSKEVVIGPCSDGGYYLIGMNNHYPLLFININWSTETVFDQTIKSVMESNLTYSILNKYSDIDTLEDWKQYLQVDV